MHTKANVKYFVELNLFFICQHDFYEFRFCQSPSHKFIRKTLSSLIFSLYDADFIPFMTLMTI